MINEGKRFEQSFRKSIPVDVYFLRLNDSAEGFDIKNSTQKFSLQSPFDCILYKRPYMYCIELKSTKGTAFSFTGNTAMIKEHQIKNLTKASSYCNAGLIFNFRITGHTYFVTIEEFNKFMSNTAKKSINEKDIKNLDGVIVIPSKKLKVNYKYDLNGLF